MFGQGIIGYVQDIHHSPTQQAQPNQPIWSCIMAFLFRSLACASISDRQDIRFSAASLALCFWPRQQLGCSGSRGLCKDVFHCARVKA